MKNDNQILERLQIVASTVSDFAKFINQTCSLQQQLDETLEYYDFDEWLSEDESYIKISSCFNAIDVYFSERFTAISEVFFNAMRLLYDLDKETFIEEFGSEITKEDILSIQEYIDENLMFLDMEHDYTIEENYENIKKVIFSAYEATQSNKYKNIQRPFFNDNFVLLKILSDNQTNVNGVKCIQLSLRDLTKVSGFSLNKVQSIMSSLIKWNYVKHESNKYILTDDGKAILNAMLKVPTTKII